MKTLKRESSLQNRIELEAAKMTLRWVPKMWPPTLPLSEVCALLSEHAPLELELIWDTIGTAWVAISPRGSRYLSIEVVGSEYYTRPSGSSRQLAFAGGCCHKSGVLCVRVFIARALYYCMVYILRCNAFFNNSQIPGPRKYVTSWSSGLLCPLIGFGPLVNVYLWGPKKFNQN